MPRIHRCVCTNTSFAALLAASRAEGLSRRELAERTGASQQCGRCRPYLRRALRTGQTVFDQLLTEADEPADDSPR